MVVHWFDHLVVLQSHHFVTLRCQDQISDTQKYSFHPQSLLERNILKQIVSRLNINVHYDLLVVCLSKLLGHPCHLGLHILLQHNCVHRILEGKTSQM